MIPKKVAKTAITLVNPFSKKEGKVIKKSMMQTPEIVKAVLNKVWQAQLEVPSKVRVRPRSLK